MCLYVLLILYGMTLDSIHSILQHRTKLSVLQYAYMGRREEEHKIDLGLHLRKQFFLCSMFKNHHKMQVKNQNKPNKSNMQYKPLVSLFSWDFFKALHDLRYMLSQKAWKVCASRLLKHIWYACLYWILYIGFTGSLAQIEAELWFIIPPGL